MVCVCVFLYILGALEGSTNKGSGEAGDRTYDPWFTRHSFYLLHHGGFYTYMFHVCEQKGH